ncbi:phosphotransferase [Pseudomaricurvus alcaniphilus]|uniref:phosphotransferase n=1 Tax=Pseudomaricurvus alcaniphilus TaxID=1166482 RepID=UPI0014091073|nr:phosphotransferase [Pseudomaricurvus alcaniphilus]NHN36536.1 phosphotransferase [Pseudomaricurvus alcaniphilus]
MITIFNKIAVLADIANLVTKVALEKIIKVPAPARLGDVPACAEAITPEWLTLVMCADYPGAKVETVRAYGGSNGTSQRRALVVTYNDAGKKAGLPEKLFTKVASSLGSRIVLGLSGAVAGESLFYNHIRGKLNLRSPKAYYAAFDKKALRTIAILSDLSDEGYTFPEPMTNPVTRKDAEDMVEQMAMYHGAMWNSPMLENELRELKNCYDVQEALNDKVGFIPCVVKGCERSRVVLPDSVYQRRHDIGPALMKALALNLEGPQTLLHQDVHPGNWLRDKDGRMGLYDWQVVTKGGWALDYSYAMTLILSTENRRAWEKDLLALYLEKLAENGVATPPTFERAWHLYCQQIFHGAVYALFTIGRSALMPKMQPDDYSLWAIQRVGQAIEDLESFNKVL